MATSRHTRLRKWMKDSELNPTEVAARLGLSESGFRRILSAKTIPTRRHNQLVLLGFPKKLLPDALDIKPGKKSFPSNLATDHHQQSATAP